MADRYGHVLSFALEHPWAVTRPMLSVIAGILARHIAGVDSHAEIEASLVNRKNLPQPRAGSIAILPVYGVLGPRMNLMSEMSGGTTFDKLTSQLRAAVADKSIKTIVLDIDSPGGTIAGNTEFAAEVMKARAKKPVIAQAQYTMGSAAYRIGAACTEIVAAPSARVGSIGVYNMHDDLSEALAKEGIKRTFVSAGDGKVDGNETGPLSDQAEARMQASVDQAYATFVSDVVKGRGAGMTADRVKKEWKAHVYSAQDALALGMIDSIATLDDTIARILAASPDAADQRALLGLTSPDATDQELPIAAATSQERQDDAHWQNSMDAALLELDL
jgi:signal peptide peptidase SppA